MSYRKSSSHLTSELNRERETFRYDHQLSHSNYRYLRDGNLPRSADLATATDSVLTGLAQLGTFQTGTDRGFISLFDSTDQYIVAEASPLIRIASGLSSASDGCPISLSLCGTVVPRSQSICDHITRLESDGMELPVSLVPNLDEDERTRSRPYCQFLGEGQFYAGVPIRTRKGIDIGVYCVMHPFMPTEWTSEHNQRLRDISRAIMDHLEYRKSSYDNQQHKRFAQGLSAFVEGRNVVQDISTAFPRLSIDGHKIRSMKDQTASIQRQNSNEAHDQDGRAPLMLHETLLIDNIPATDYTAETETPPYTNGASAANVSCRPSTSTVRKKEGEQNLVFSNAARLIQETFNVHGCVFADVSLGSHRQLGLADKATTAANPDKAQDSIAPSSSGDEYQHSLHGEPVDANSDVLGSAEIKDLDLDNKQALYGSVGCISKRFLAKLLRRYPNGKVFNFDAVGELQPSDSSEDDGTHIESVAHAATTSNTGSSNIILSTTAEVQQEKKLIRRHEEGKLIQKAFPNARSLMFVPVWNPKSERWLSGGFIYSNSPARFFAVHDELNLALAFSKVISAEYLNLEIMQTEKAKSDALGSLSHELRSPLHGIILSTEMLNDTDLTVYQGNAMHTIETCCRTLLDTIDHLLDFSKVNNNFASPADGGLVATNRQGRPPTESSLFGKKSLYKHLRLDGLVEDVIGTVFAGFNFARLSPDQFGPPSNSRVSISRDNPGLDIRMSDQWLGTFESLAAGKDGSENVAVYFICDPAQDWGFNVQPGALRRIIMNLVGNSLKYTASGTIKVILGQEASSRSHSQRLIKLTVSDTGCGISEGFLQHSLFQPFTQEDEISPGIGLGLSLVKKMVSQLRGRIKVQSQVGVGTTVEVTLPQKTMMGSPSTNTHPRTEDDGIFEEQVRDLTGLRVRIGGFGSDWGSEGYTLVKATCLDWLKLNLATAEENCPDVLLLSEDMLSAPQDGGAFSTSRTPTIVVCRDAPAAWRLHKAYETADASHVIEFVSQPIAPRILARAILHAYQRWTVLPELVLLPRPHTLRRAHSVGSEQISPLSTTPLPPFPGLEDDALMNETEKESQSQQLARQMSLLATSSPIEEEPPPTLNLPKDKKLLLVDDNYINLKVLSAIITKLGHGYEVATNGQEALDTYLKYPAEFSVILMDISMPVMDGLEATRQIRAHEHTNGLARTPVLALTGLSSESTHREALESGVNVYLTKPVKFKSISEALESVGVRSP